ncbi:MAG: AraC family transcriptional regulator [Clostridiales bacterium]|nr:AraC family transcriptional regulator [Clostridiales bacterium]
MAETAEDAGRKQPVEPYKPTFLCRELDVRSVITVHYFEFDRDYIFTGESHPFWELLYVDKGSVMVDADGERYRLSQGELIFHQPDEFHTVVADGVSAPNLAVISFDCPSPAMDFFREKRLRADETERELLSRLLKEAGAAFSTPLDHPAVTRLSRAASAPFGAEQMVGLLLEELLISLIRRERGERRTARVTSTVRRRSGNELVARIIAYMEDNACGSLSFSDICRFSAQSATNLKTIFKSATGKGVMEYYRQLKIDTAKKMLREGEGNITQIADRLGYASVHYFSRYFKQATGMTPSEYTLSVRSK